MSIENDNKAIVRRWMELFSEARFDEAFAMVADDVEWIGPFTSIMGATLAKDDILAIAPKVVAQTIGGWRMWPIGFTAEGDRIAVQAESHADMKDGKIYHQQYHFLMVIRAGKIAKVYEYADSLHTSEVLAGVLS